MDGHCDDVEISLTSPPLGFPHSIKVDWLKVFPLTREEPQPKREVLKAVMEVADVYMLSEAGTG